MREKLQALGIDLSGIGHSGKTLCPVCSASRKNKRDKCLSVDVDKGVYNCHNCSWKGGVGEIKEMFTTPEFNNTELSDKTLEYFNQRGISKNTILRFKITQSTDNAGNWINFNYFRDEKLVNIKYRSARKEFRLNKGSELIFYGLDLIKDSTEAIITEGEFDALSFYEAELFHVVSVPNGASKGSQRLDYLDNCWKYFEDKRRIILATDNDEAGISLRNELARRLGKERCSYLDFGDCKDANEVLIKHGKSAIVKIYNSAVEFPVEGVVNANDISSDIDNLYENGIAKGVTIDSHDFDEHLTWQKRELLIVTGIPGSGKSNLMDWIKINLAVRHNWKFALFTPEQNPFELHFRKLAEMLIGKPFWGTGRMNKAQLEYAKTFISDHFFWIKIDENDLSIDGILDKFRELVVRKGINACEIDPYNYIEHKIPKGYSETQYISELLTKVKRFKDRNDVHFTIVAHPTKIQKEKDSGKYKVPTLYDIAGSAHFFNKTDNGFTVYRDFETGEINVYVQKVRHNFIGKLGKVDLKYNRENGRYVELGSKESFDMLQIETVQSEAFAVHQEKVISQYEERECPF